MYVTRLLSTYKKNPDALSLPLPEGPSSGILVIQEEEAENTCCFGLCKSCNIKDLPFPQNKKLEHWYASGLPPHRYVHYHDLVFIPVLNQPLSSNLYYAIQPYGKHKRQAYTNAKEEDIETNCFSSYAPDDTPPQPLDPNNKHQQFEIRIQAKTILNSGGFVAKSIAPDGLPPKFLGKKGWKLRTLDSEDIEIGEAQGIDTTLRASLPELNFPILNKSSNPVVVGKWYCPFVFIKEGAPKTLNDERRKSMYYYEMTLEQKWEKMFASDNINYTEGKKTVVVDAVVKKEVITVSGWEAKRDERNGADGVVWFRSCNNLGEETSVGLSEGIVERMKWEQERVGWVGGNEMQVTVKRVEEFGGVGKWRIFGCYILVERFVLKRLDGSLVLTYDFKHSHQIRSKWE